MASAFRKQISLQQKLDVIRDIDNGLKQIDTAKKHGFSQSTVATFLKKRKDIEEKINLNLVDPSRKRLKMQLSVMLILQLLNGFKKREHRTFL